MRAVDVTGLGAVGREQEAALPAAPRAPAAAAAAAAAPRPGQSVKVITAVTWQQHTRVRAWTDSQTRLDDVVLVLCADQQPLWRSTCS